MTSKVIASSKFIFLGSIVTKCATFAGSIALARLLYPADFGYLAFTTVFTAFLQQIGNFGIEVFYLQEKHKDAAEEEAVVQIVFKLRLMANAILFIAQNLGALICYVLMSEPVTAQLLLIFSLTYVLEAWSSVNAAKLKKEMNFKPVAIANTLRDVSSVVFRVLFASIGMGPLCFGLGAVIGSLAQTAFIARSQPIKIDWAFWDKSIARKVFHFSKHVMISSLGSYGSQQIDKLFLVSFFDPTSVGLYSFGNSNASMPFTYIFSPQQQLILSLCANLKDKPEVLLSRVLEIARAILLVMGPLHILAVFNCELIIGTLFGSNWLPAAQYTKLFAIYFFFLSILLPFNGLLTALGRPDIISRISVVKMVVLVPCLFLFAGKFPNLVTYCMTFCAISILFDLLKSHQGLTRIGGSIFSTFTSNADVLTLLSVVIGINALVAKLAPDRTIVLLILNFLMTMGIWSYYWFARSEFAVFKQLKPKPKS